MKTLMLSVVTAALLSAGAACAGDDVRPNILFLLADDMGWQDTSVPFAKQRTKWNDRNRTPALQRLARDGMKFTQAYASLVEGLDKSVGDLLALVDELGIADKLRIYVGTMLPCRLSKRRAGGFRYPLRR